ncbi:formin-like protein 4 isoform X2 [Cucumis melo var. makuwa]|uniref:Formin-like protein 4 isoform X2 n=1 Tax=Cucumis melo var. makuwa TaxID=1194695 RepID=A0A5D3D027_CUCMM|nr:formin-like protein 4 isoform X2 [Cucumis melo var. makuwa]TYK16848.1 formin-like protein 4 isoform X2 [Cucumis melo var. makuwa]
MTLQLKHENTVTNEWHEIQIGLVYMMDGYEKTLRVYLKQILRHDLNFHSPIEKEEGKEVSEIKLFQLTHSNKKKGWVNKPKAKYDEMVELETTSSQEGSEPLLEREICERVLGKRSGHVKGQGWGPRPKNARNESIQHNTKEENPQIAHLQIMVVIDSFF